MATLHAHAGSMPDLDPHPPENTAALLKPVQHSLQRCGEHLLTVHLVVGSTSTNQGQTKNRSPKKGPTCLLHVTCSENDALLHHTHCATPTTLMANTA